MLRFQLLAFATLGSAMFACSVAAQQPSGGSRAGSQCICPKEGRWNVQNHEGHMKCSGPVTVKKKLKPEKDKGTIWVIDEGCVELFGEAPRKKEDDMLMERTKDCDYEGLVHDEEESVDMVIDVTWTFENDSFLTGEMSSTTTHMGMTCEYYRTFEIAFDETLRADEYRRSREKMLDKLEHVREVKERYYEARR